MDHLHLDAVDADDLAIFSAHCQDAVLTLGTCRYLPRERRFVLAMNRFAWEKAPVRRRFSFRPAVYERRQSVLHFERVESVHRIGLDQSHDDAVLVLLALRFTPTEAPSGLIELVFAGGSAIRLGVECIEARLTDLGASWGTMARPSHDDAAG